MEERPWQTPGTLEGLYIPSGLGTSWVPLLVLKDIPQEQGTAATLTMEWHLLCWQELKKRNEYNWQQTLLSLDHLWKPNHHFTAWNHGLCPCVHVQHPETITHTLAWPTMSIIPPQSRWITDGTAKSWVTYHGTKTQLVESTLDNGYEYTRFLSENRFVLILWILIIFNISTLNTDGESHISVS